MAEILAGGGIHKAFKALGIEAKRTYKSSHEPYYEVWELDKKDIRVLEDAYEWPDEWSWYGYAKGSNMGSAANFFTVNGQFLIGWETHDGNETYDTLIDYLYDGLDAKTAPQICALAVDLARVNGKTLGGLFKMYEG